jgi:hypothetical protein
LSETEQLEWRELNDLTQVASVNGEVVGVIYAVTGAVLSESGVQAMVEFWWLPADAPEREEVLFGEGEGSAGWDARWERARKAVEWIRSN